MSEKSARGSTHSTQKERVRIIPSSLLVEGATDLAKVTVPDSLLDERELNVEQVDGGKDIVLWFSGRSCEDNVEREYLSLANGYASAIITPDQARQLADALIQFAEHIENESQDSERTNHIR